jgi:hypothetical protein
MPVTTTAIPALTAPAMPLPGVSPSIPRPMATLATGVTAEMTGSVISGRPVWYAVWVSSTVPAPAAISA